MTPSNRNTGGEFNKRIIYKGVRRHRGVTMAKGSLLAPDLKEQGKGTITGTFRGRVMEKGLP